MKRKGLRLRMCLTVALSLCLTMESLTLAGTSVDVKAEEVEDAGYTEQEIYVLPEVGETYPYGEYEFGYKILSDNTIEIVSFSGGKSYGMDMKVDIPGVIEEKAVTSIGASAFRNCIGISSVTIPEGVTSIGAGAFSDCAGISSIIIPEGVTNIGSGAFNGCSKLSNITIPEGVTSIGSGAFYGCISLSNIAIPEGVTSIEGYVFSGCRNLSSIIIPEGITSIGNSAFDSCSNLSDIIIPEGVTSIGDSAFWGCSKLSNITIPEGVTSIRAFAFAGCSNLSNIIIPESVIRIGQNAFVACSSLSSITIPEGVTSIGLSTFAGCSNLSSISIPEKVTSIGGAAFENCTGITKICNNSAEALDLSYFANCNIQWYNQATGEVITELGTGTAISQYYVDDTAVRDFVNRLYTLVLDRNADEIGLESWTNALVNGESNGVDIGYGFVFSDECKEKNLSNEDFVEILYNTFMNRPSDEGGKASWVSQLDAGVEREKVFAGFIYSTEFANICNEYKIEVGNVFEVGRLADALAHYRNQNADITKFVARCYTEAMGRAYEPDGLEAWCKVIIEKSNTPKQVAQNFIFSAEFVQKDLSDEEYVKVLYRTFMGREADEAGLAGWVEVLGSGREDRMKVMEGFSDSVEFDGILQSFGLN